MWSSLEGSDLGVEEESGLDCGRGLSSFGVVPLDRFPSGVLLLDSDLLSGDVFAWSDDVFLSCVGPGLTMLLGSWNKKDDDLSWDFDSFFASDDSREVELDSLASDFESASVFVTSLPLVRAFSFSASLAFTFTGSKLSLRS